MENDELLDYNFDQNKKRKRKQNKEPHSRKKTAFKESEKYSERKQKWLEDGKMFQDEEMLLFTDETIEKIQEMKFHAIGIDVGKKHLGCAAFDEKEKLKIILLISIKNRETTADTMDRLVYLFHKHPKLKWVQNVLYYCIEQQNGMLNHSAFALSIGLRSLMKSWSLKNKGETYFICADNKYKVAPLYKVNQDDKIRLKRDKGTKLTGLERKKLGEHDTTELIKKLDHNSFWEDFFQVFKTQVDQIHDCTDGFLLGRCFFDNLLPKKK